MTSPTPAASGKRHFVAWAFGVFFALMALVSLVSSFPAALLLLLAAAVTLPPISQRLRQKIAALSRTWVRVVVAVIAFSTVVRMMGGLEDVQPQQLQQNTAPAVAAPTTSPTPTPTVVNKDAAEKDLKDFMDLGIKANLVDSYDFSDSATVVYVSPVWYTQTVAFKKDFLAKTAMLKKAVTGYGYFEVRDSHSNEKVAEVTAFSQSLEVYK